MSIKLINVLDYDDSVLCSSVLTLEAHKQQCDILSIKISPSLYAQLRQLAASIITTITTMQRYGTTYIVTNAETGWVLVSCVRFLPELLPYVTGKKALPVISAADLYKSKSIEHSPNGADWKYFAICQILQLEARYDVFLFIIGDSNEEREAGKRIRDESSRNQKGELGYKSPTKVRTLKMANNPTVAGLIRQHRAIQGSLAHLIYMETVDDITLQLPLTEHALIQALTADKISPETKQRLLRLARQETAPS